MWKNKKSDQPSWYDCNFCGFCGASSGQCPCVTVNKAERLTRDLGCDRMTLSSFLGSNERVQVGMLKRWQTVLGIQLLDKKLLDDTWKSYMKQLLE